MSTPPQAKVLRALVAPVGVAGLVACGSDEPPDIAHVDEVKSNFGPDFTVDTFSSGIDPAVLNQQSLPPGVIFEPAECQDYVAASVIPADLQGNMSAVSAEGEGNRFITIALETSEPVPINQPSDQCQKVGFDGGVIRGLVEVVEAPQIEGATTLGQHRIYQTTIDGKLSTGELYQYFASFDNYQVIVTANPLVVPDQETKAVDTDRARELLSDAVSAVRG